MAESGAITFTPVFLERSSSPGHNLDLQSIAKGGKFGVLTEDPDRDGGRPVLRVGKVVQGPGQTLET